MKTTNGLSEELARIVTMVKRIEVYGGDVPQMERDILLQQLRDFYVTVLEYNTEKKPLTLIEEDVKKNEKPAVFAPPESDHTPEAKAQPVMKEDVNFDDIFGEMEDSPLEEATLPEKGLLSEVPIETKPEPVVEMTAPVEEMTAPVVEMPDPLEEAPKGTTSIVEAGEKASGLLDFDEKPIATAPLIATAATLIAAEEKTEILVENPKPVETQAVEESHIAEESKPEAAVNETKSSLMSLLKNGEREEMQPTARTLGDTLEQGHASIGDYLGSHSAKSKVSDLRTIININDKFSFMSELFHNNMKAYNDFVMQLNNISEREEAVEYISQVAQQYNWDMNSLAVKTFNKYFERKF